MRRKLESWAAAVGMAEEGCHDGALEIMRELKQLEHSTKAKIIVIADDDALTNDRSMHLAGLAQRLASEILFISSNRRFSTGAKLPKTVLGLQELLSKSVQLVYIPSAGHVERVLKTALHSMHHVEFAVLVGNQDRGLSAKLNVPVFTL